IWPDPTGKRTRCPVFHLPRLRDGWARCSEGLEHPHTHKVRPVVFDHDLAAGRDGGGLIHPNHPVAQMDQPPLRAEMWSRRERAGLHRVTARLVPDEALDTPAVVAHGRLVVLGGDDRRLHEEIIEAGAFLRDGRLSRMAIGQTEAALRAAKSDP